MSELSILLLVILPFVALLVWAIVEIVTRSDLGILRRVGWFSLVVILPVVGLAGYVALRPPKRAQLGGRADAAKAETIVLLAERRQRGEISDEEFRTEVRALS